MFDTGRNAFWTDVSMGDMIQALAQHTNPAYLTSDNHIRACSALLITVLSVKTPRIDALCGNRLLVQLAHHGDI